MEFLAFYILGFCITGAIFNLIINNAMSYDEEAADIFGHKSIKIVSLLVVALFWILTLPTFVFNNLKTIAQKL